MIIMNNIVDYRINQKTSKEQFNVKLRTINGKKHKILTFASLLILH
jgi:hypothetical protein